jgi:hypothetical protein
VVEPAALAGVEPVTGAEADGTEPGAGVPFERQAARTPDEIPRPASPAMPPSSLRREISG